MTKINRTLETLYFLSENIPGGTYALYEILGESLGGGFGVASAVLDLVMALEALMGPEWEDERAGEFLIDIQKCGGFTLEYVTKTHELPSAEQLQTFLHSTP